MNPGLVKVNTREHESTQVVVPVTSVAAGPAIETIAAAMQAEPGLFVAGTYVQFGPTGGVRVNMHRNDFAEVSAMASLLGVSATPVSVSRQGEGDDPVIVVRLNNGNDYYDGGIEIFWFASWSAALAVLGPNAPALVNA